MDLQWARRKNWPAGQSQGSVIGKRIRLWYSCKSRPRIIILVSNGQHIWHIATLKSFHANASAAASRAPERLPFAHTSSHLFFRSHPHRCRRSYHLQPSCLTRLQPLRPLQHPPLRKLVCFTNCNMTPLRHCGPHSLVVKCWTTDSKEAELPVYHPESGTSTSCTIYWLVHLQPRRSI